jgi:hypothetical protein
MPAALAISNSAGERRTERGDGSLGLPLGAVRETGALTMCAVPVGDGAGGGGVLGLPTYRDVDIADDRVMHDAPTRSAT